MIEEVFRWILEEIAQAGYLSPEVVFVDGTHIKANANLKKHVKKSIPKAAKRYQEQLLEEVDADRTAHGKKPLHKDDDDDDPKPPEEKRINESTTDAQSGFFDNLNHADVNVCVIFLYLWNLQFIAFRHILWYNLQ